MLTEYLNQEAVYCPALRNSDGSTVMDSRGQIQYGAPAVITCRYHSKITQVLLPDGTAVKSSGHYRLEQSVKPDDMLDGKLVLAVSDYVMLEGIAVGCKAVT